MLSFSLKFILNPNFAPLFWRLLVSEFLLGVFTILHCSVSAPPVKIVPSQDVHRLLMLSRDDHVFGSRNILPRHIL
jgi:hypothetical protein